MIAGQLEAPRAGATTTKLPSRLLSFPLSLSLGAQIEHFGLGGFITFIGAIELRCQFKIYT